MRRETCPEMGKMGKTVNEVFGHSEVILHSPKMRTKIPADPPLRQLAESISLCIALLQRRSRQKDRQGPPQKTLRGKERRSQIPQSDHQTSSNAQCPHRRSSAGINSQSAQLRSESFSTLGTGRNHSALLIAPA